jgi:hypothetical protein
MGKGVCSLIKLFFLEVKGFTESYNQVKIDKIKQYFSYLSGSNQNFFQYVRFDLFTRCYHSQCICFSSVEKALYKQAIQSLLRIAVLDVHRYISFYQ